MKIMSNYDVAKNLMKIIEHEAYNNADKIKNVSSPNKVNYVKKSAEFCDKFVKEVSTKAVK